MDMTPPDDRRTITAVEAQRSLGIPAGRGDLNYRPGWLADDEQWRDQMDALSREDIAWLTSSWESAGGKPPTVDVSWVKMEHVRAGRSWADSALIPLALIILCFVCTFGPLMVWQGTR